MPTILKGGAPSSPSTGTAQAYTFSNASATINVSDTSFLVLGFDIVLINGNDKLLARLQSFTKNTITFVPLSSPVNAVLGTVFPVNSIISMAGLDGITQFQSAPTDLNLNDNQVVPQVIPQFTVALVAVNFRKIRILIRRGNSMFNGTMLLVANPTSAEISLEGLEIGDVGIHLSVALNGPNLEISYTSTNQGALAHVRFYSEDDLV